MSQHMPSARAATRHGGLTFRPAERCDLGPVRRLLQDAALPLDGLEDCFGAAYVIAARNDGAIVGVAGMEAHGGHGLLRSVAVSAEARGQGLGAALVQDRLAWASRRGLAGVHLLTTTAAAWFERFGFIRAERDALPAGIRASVEFATACPQSALAMSLAPRASAAARGAAAGRAFPRRAAVGRTAGAGAAPGDLERLLDAARGESQAMRCVDHLANVIGPRLSGSVALEVACAWAHGQFEAIEIDARLVRRAPVLGPRGGAIPPTPR